MRNRKSEQKVFLSFTGKAENYAVPSAERGQFCQGGRRSYGCGIRSNVGPDHHRLFGCDPDIRCGHQYYIRDCWLIAERVWCQLAIEMDMTLSADSLAQFMD